MLGIIVVFRSIDYFRHGVVFLLEAIASSHSVGIIIVSSSSTSSSPEKWLFLHWDRYSHSENHYEALQVRTSSNENKKSV